MHKWFLPTKHAIEQDCEIVLTKPGSPEPGDTVELIMLATVGSVLGEEIDLKDLRPVRILSVYRRSERDG